MPEATAVKQRVQHSSCKATQAERLDLLETIAADEESFANKLVRRFGQKAYRTIRAYRGLASEAQAQAQTLRAALGGESAT